MERKEIFRLGRSRKFELEDAGVKLNRQYKSSKSSCDDGGYVDLFVSEKTIVKIRFSHEGCLLSRAALNALVESLQDKTIEEAKGIIIKFRNMLDGNLKMFDLPESLMLFQKFSKFPSRKHCLFLGCDLVLKAIEDQGC